MNLVVDIGNSRAKLAVFKNSRLIDSCEPGIGDKASIETFLKQHLSIDRCIISSVKNREPGITEYLQKKEITTIQLSNTTSLPFVNAYKTPETLGADRIAAVAGAICLHPGKDILIIDAGTAITFDFISKDNIYQGGTISPGLEMRFKALNQFTANLPLCSKSDDTGLTGKTTYEAIVNGVQNGILFEAEFYLNEFRDQYPQMVVLLTGGDAQFFENKLKNPIFTVSNLTLIGLNFILEYNAQKL
jgi:type III pantothenate kinase